MDPKSLSRAVGDATYHAAINSGMSRDDARRLELENRQRIALNAPDAIKTAFRDRDRRMLQAEHEANRLRAERDALIDTLAAALGTTASTALSIARLDMDALERMAA